MTTTTALLEANLTIRPESLLDWANHKNDHYNKLLVSVGAISTDHFPGGGFTNADNPAIPVGEYIAGHYGSTSAITGTITVPIEADQSKDSAGVNLIFISAGLMGLAITEAHDAVGVGTFSAGHAGVNQSRVWGENVVVSNKINGIPGWGRPYHVNMIASEIDLLWEQPNANTDPGNSNVFGMTIAGEFHGGRPLGALSGIEVFAYNGLPWKTAYGTGHGAADNFAQISMGKKEEASGAASSQRFEFISCNSGQGASNAYRYGYFMLDAGGDFLMQPNYYGQPGKLTVANAFLTQASSISAVDGFSGPKVTTNELSVFGNSTITGNLNVYGETRTTFFNFQGQNVSFANPGPSGIGPNQRALVIG